MALIAIGINHQTANVDKRGLLSLAPLKAVEMAEKLVSEGYAIESVILSTCNRTELYCEAEEIEALLPYFIAQFGLSVDTMAPYLYTHLGIAAAVHLMKVTTGLDSMILGEAQILGQVKESFRAAHKAGTAGKHLGKLFQTAFAVSKKVRFSTGIGVNPVSVGYMAAKLAQHIFSDLADTSVLLIGAGDLIQLTARHLKEMGVRKIKIANRQVAKAAPLAQLFNAEVYSLEQISELLPWADMVIAGTASEQALIEAAQVQEALSIRKRKPMLMIDLSVPRNIEKNVQQFEDVYLYCIDDLEKVVEHNKQARLKASKAAEGLIEEAAYQFMNWLQAQESFKILSFFRKKIQTMSEQLLQEGLRHIELGESPEAVFKRLTYRLTNRFLHEPTKRLRTASLHQEEALLTLTRDLFELHHETFHTK